MSLNLKKLKFPHIEGNEIELPKETKEDKPKAEKHAGPRGQEMINGKIILGRGTDLTVPLPIYLPKDRKGNYEPEIDKSGHTGT